MIAALARKLWQSIWKRCSGQFSLAQTPRCRIRHQNACKLIWIVSLPWSCRRRLQNSRRTRRQEQTTSQLSFGLCWFERVATLFQHVLGQQVSTQELGARNGSDSVQERGYISAQQLHTYIIVAGCSDVDQLHAAGVEERLQRSQLGFRKGR